jgi:hypothetical protein
VDSKRKTIRSLKKELSRAKAREAGLRDQLEKLSSSSSTSSTSSVEGGQNSSSSSGGNTNQGAIVLSQNQSASNRLSNPPAYSPATLKKLATRGVSTSVLTPFDAQRYQLHASVPTPSLNLLPLNNSYSSPSKSPLSPNSHSRKTHFTSNQSTLDSPQSDTSPRLSEASVREKINHQQQLKILLELRSTLRTLAQTSSLLNSSASSVETKNMRITFDSTVVLASNSIEKLLAFFQTDESP